MNVVHVQIVDVLPHDKAASDHARRRMLLMTNQRGAMWSRDPPSTNHSSPGDGDHVDDEDVADHGHQRDQHVADRQQDRHGARHLAPVILFRLVILSTINNLKAATML